MSEAGTLRGALEDSFNGFALVPLSASGNLDYTEEDAEFRFAGGTVFTYNGVSYDLAEQYGSINAITDIRRAGKYLVIDGHVGPKNGMYCIFDTESEAFVKSFPGANLIWRDDDLSTGVYSYWSKVYDYEGRILGEIPLTWADYIESLRFTDGNLEIDGFVEVAVNHDGRRMTTLVARDGRDMRGEFVGVLGRDGQYIDYLYETPEQNWDVREYYVTDINGNKIVIAESMGVDRYIDVDGDGIRELVCDVARPDGWEGTYYYRLYPHNELTVERAEVAAGETLANGAYQYFATLPIEDGPLMVNGGDTMLVYYNLLRQIYVDLSEYGEAELPDGAGTLKLMGVDGKLGDNRFAVCDVNGDGAVELILRFVTAPIVADMRDYIYCYDKHDMLGNGSLWCAGSVFFGCAYYDNGYITEDFTHGDDSVFWPYFLHRYNAETGRYDLIAYAESGEDAITVGTGYSDGDGFDHRERMDAAAYDAWDASWRGGAREIVPEWQDFTIRNIDALIR